MNKHSIIISALLAFMLLGCATQRVSTIIACDYDKNKNQTDYIVFPYGNASLPGKWNRTNYNSVSKQQFFKNEDSVEVAIAFASCNSYEFNQDKSKTGFRFVQAFYEWEWKYFEDEFKLEHELIEQDSLQNFILWRVQGNFKNTMYDTYFLVAEKNCYVSSFSIPSTSKLSRNEKIAFLKGLLKN